MRPIIVVSLIVCLLAAFPAASATKRAVKPLTMVPYAGVLTDATTSQPVVGVELRTGTQVATSDSSGNFTLQVPLGRPTSVTAHRTGYQDLTFEVTVPFGGGIPVSFPLPPTPTAPVALQPLPTVSVRLTSGQTVHLDADSVQFAYVLPFETPQGSNSASFCTIVDGKAWSPDRGDLAQIIGPAAPVSNAACCKLGPMLGVDVKIKGSGLPIKAAFADSCFGYDIDFVGRDHESAQYIYLNFKDIALITFP